jgi:hypothetical protein
MSYADEFKVLIQQEQEATVDKYKEFMQDMVLPEMAKATDAVAIIHNQDLRSAGVHKAEFREWLKSEDFKVEEKGQIQFLVSIVEFSID